MSPLSLDNCRGTLWPACSPKPPCLDGLLQITGTKRLTLFAPQHSGRLYESHIPEAELSYREGEERLVKETLLDSTSMVMSPVDIKSPNLERFPKFAEATPMTCEIGPGDILFLPSFWWHEVQSTPNATTRRNIAVNWWYHPLLVKEFPCPECGLEFNDKEYRPLLDSHLSTRKGELES